MVYTRRSAYMLCSLAWGFVGLQTTQVRVSLILLPAYGTYFLLLDRLISLDMRGFAWSYCIFLHHVWLMSLRGLILSEGKQKQWIWGGEGDWKERRLQLGYIV